MKYEGQLVLLGFILGIVLVAISVIVLNRDKRKIENCHKILLIEMEAFYLNSFVGIISIFMGVLSLTYAIGAAVQGYWEEKGASAFQSVLLFVAIALCFCLFLVLSHPSVLMGKYFGRRVYMKSIKSEKFTRYSENIWASEHWIRIGERFVPKTCLIGIRLDAGRHRGKVIYNLLTIDGREKCCRMAISRIENAHEDERILQELVTTKHFYTKMNWPNTGLAGAEVEMYGHFVGYLEKHKDLDLINDQAFANELLQEVYDI